MSNKKTTGHEGGILAEDACTHRLMPLRLHESHNRFRSAHIASFAADICAEGI